MSTTRKRTSLLKQQQSPVSSKGKITSYFQRLPGPAPPPPPPAAKNCVSPTSKTPNNLPAAQRSQPLPLPPTEDAEAAQVDKLESSIEKPVVKVKTEPQTPTKCSRMSREAEITIGPLENPSSAPVADICQAFESVPAPQTLPDESEPEAQPPALNLTPDPLISSSPTSTTTTEPTQQPSVRKKPKKPVKVHYCCPYCKKIFEFFNQFVRHLRTHDSEPRTKSQSQIIIESTVYLEEIEHPEHSVDELMAMNKLSIVEQCQEFVVKPEFDEEGEDVKPEVHYMECFIPPCEGASSSPSPSPSPPPSPPLPQSSEYWWAEEEEEAPNEFHVAHAQVSVNQPEEIAENDSAHLSGGLPKSTPSPCLPPAAPAATLTCSNCKFGFAHRASLKYHLQNRVCFDLQRRKEWLSRWKRKAAAASVTVTAAAEQKKPGHCRRALKRPQQPRKDQEERPEPTTNPRHSTKKKSKLPPHLLVKCEHCNRDFTQLGLKYHVNNRVCQPKNGVARGRPKKQKRSWRVGPELLKCVNCQLKFTKRGLNYHLHNRVCHQQRQKRKESAPPKEYKCKLCQKDCKTRVGLSIHRRAHIGEKRYTCQYCPKKFASKGSTQNHERIHTGEKPYSCEYCDQRFRFRSNLKSHVRSHTGEKSHECEFCERKFAHRSTLVCHRRRHTGEKPFSCGNCEAKFSQLTALKYHVKVGKCV